MCKLRNSAMCYGCDARDYGSLIAAVEKSKLYSDQLKIRWIF